VRHWYAGGLLRRATCQWDYGSSENTRNES
jgi:hypothetical protein